MIHWPGRLLVGSPRIFLVVESNVKHLQAKAISGVAMSLRDLRSMLYRASLNTYNTQQPLCMFTESINIKFHIDFNNITLLMIFIKMLEYNISYVINSLQFSNIFWSSDCTHSLSGGRTTDLEVVLFGHEFVVSVGTVVADQFVPAPLEGLGVSEAIDTLPNTVDHL